MLDLANVTAPGTARFAAYRDAWEGLTGLALDRQDVEVQYASSALQIPVQYLPWQVENQSADAVEETVDRADRALHEIRARV